MKIENKKELQKLIEEEVTRSAIRDIIEKDKTSNLDKYLRHPLTLLIVGFFFTVVLGGAISFFTDLIQKQFEDARQKEQKDYEKLRQEGQKKSELTRQALENVRDFHSTLAKRRNEAVYFKVALEKKNIRNDDKTLKKIKESYDKSVKDWNTKFLSNLLIIRQAADSRDKIFFESIISNNLVPILATIDKCLVNEFDYPTNSNKIKCRANINLDAPVDKAFIEWDQEKGRLVEIEILLESAQQCGYSLTNTLYWWMFINLKISDRGWKNSATGTAEAIKGHCRDAIKKALKP